jgi:hypothetical protein
MHQCHIPAAGHYNKCSAGHRLAATYRTLLRTPGAAAFFLTGAAGPAGIAMTSLGIVWLVHARTGSYAPAGLVTGGFALAEAVTGPQLARLTDRFGQAKPERCRPGLPGWAG